MPKLRVVCQKYDNGECREQSYEHLRRVNHQKNALSKWQYGGEGPI